MTNASTVKHFHFLILLAMAYVSIDLASNIVAYKWVAVGPALESGASFVFPITYFIGDIITEVYGYRVIRQVIWGDIFCTLLFASFVSLVLHIHGASFWRHQQEFSDVLGNLSRVTLASFLGTVTGGFINGYVISKMKVATNGRYFWIRSLTSTAVGELVFILIVAIAGFTGVLTASQLIRFIISDYALKLLFSLLLVYPTAIAQKVLKKVEKIDVYDHNIDYTPFKFKG